MRFRESQLVVITEKRYSLHFGAFHLLICILILSNLPFGEEKCVTPLNFPIEH